MPGPLHRVTEALEHLDLTPRSPVLPGGRSIYGGIIFLLYLPLLVLYLYSSIVPLYGPLPSCCACSTYDTPANSFIYMGNNDTCSSDPSCKDIVKSQLALNCDAAVNYETPLLDTIRVDIALIICAGMDDGAPCTSKCLDVSARWLGAQDYTSDLNRNQALVRCPSQVGVCDFKALYQSGSDSKFPMSICRYPDLTNILTRLGAGLGLINGLLVTVRMLIRAVWIRVAEKKEDDGKPRDYASGLFYGIIFNYFSVTYFLVSSTTSKRMRYGAQISVGLIVVFLKTPLVVSLVYLLGQFWAPMTIYSVVSGVAYAILFRTLYCMLRLETRSRDTSRTEDEIRLINDMPPSPNKSWRGPFREPQPKPQPSQQISHLSQRLFSHLSQRLFSQPQPQHIQQAQPHQTQQSQPQQTQNAQLSQQFPQSQPQTHLSQRTLSGDSTKKYGSMDDSGSEAWIAPLYPHSIWRNFLLGFAGNIFTFIFMLKMSWPKKNSGFFAGAMCGTSIMMLVISWVFMYALMLWPHILFDFPFPVNYPITTVIYQSIYFTYATVFSILFVYYLCSFLKARPDHATKMEPGTKYHYRMAFILSSLPVVVMFVIFFVGFYLPYTNRPMPGSISDCNFPIYQVLIPFLGVIPGFIVFLVAKISRIRWGAFAACGFSFLALSIVLNIFIFQYCLGSTPHRRPFYPLVFTTELVGSFIVIYGAIRPNQVRHTRIYEDLEQDHEPPVVIE